MLRKIFLKRNILIYYLSSFFGDIFFISAVLIPFFREWCGLSQAKVQLLQSWFMLWIFLLEVPTGVVADCLGRKYSLIAGTLAEIVGLLVYTTQRQFWAFLLAEFSFSLGRAFNSGAQQALIYDSLKELGQEKEAKRIFAQGESFRRAGTLVSALIGSLLARFFTPEKVVLASIIPFLICLVLVLLFVEPAIQTSSEEKRFLTILKEGGRVFLSQRTFQLLAADMILVAVGAYFVVWFYQLKLLKAGVPTHWLGVFAAILNLAQISVLKTVGFWERIFGGEEKYFLLSALLASVGFIISGLGQSWLFVLPLILLAGGFGLSRRSVYSGVINRFIPSPQRATINSFISMLRSVVVALLNPLVGFLVDRNLNLTLILIGVFILIGQILVYLFSLRLSFGTSD